MNINILCYPFDTENTYARSGGKLLSIENTTSKLVYKSTSQKNLMCSTLMTLSAGECYVIMEYDF